MMVQNLAKMQKEYVVFSTIEEEEIKEEEAEEISEVEVVEISIKEKVEIILCLPTKEEVIATNKEAILIVITVENLATKQLIVDSNIKQI